MKKAMPVFIAFLLFVATVLGVWLGKTWERKGPLSRTCCATADEKEKLDNRSLEIVFGSLSKTLTTLEKPDQDRYVDLAFDIAKHDLIREDADFPHKQHAAVWKEDGVVKVCFLSRNTVELGIAYPGDEPYATVYFDWPSGKAIKMVDRQGHTVESPRIHRLGGSRHSRE